MVFFAFGANAQKKGEANYATKKDAINSTNPIYPSGLPGITTNYSKDVVFSEDFETGNLDAWTLYNEDGDAFEWRTLDYDGSPHGGSYFAASASFDNTAGILTPDNWLVSSAIILPAGTLNLEYWVGGMDQLYAAEHYALYISTTGNAVSDFTEVLLEETTGPTTENNGYWLKEIDLTDYSGQTVYLAWRHYNISDMFELILDDITITHEGIPGAPQAATDFVLTADDAGALTCDFAWTNPTLQQDENALTELTVELFIDDNPVAIFTDPTPDNIGGAISETGFDLTIYGAGMHTFTVIPSNTAGAGVPASVEVYVGEDVPAAPGNIALVANDMIAELSWEAPTVGLNGAYFSGTGITYDVFRNGTELVSDDQTELSFSETLATAGNYFYTVVVSNTIGEGGTATSDLLLFGDYLLYEDFETGATEWTQEGTGVWTFQAGGASGNPATAYEGDFNAACLHSASGNTTKLISPEVAVSSTGNYTLNFAMAQVNWSGDQDELKVYYKDGAAGTWVEIAHYPNEVATWTEEEITFSSVNAPYIAFEGIDGYGYGNCVDLVTVLEAPPTYTVTFTVDDGTDPVENAEVTINEETVPTNELGVAVFHLVDGDHDYSIETDFCDTYTGTVPVSGDVENIPVSLTCASFYDITFHAVKTYGDLANVADVIVTVNHEATGSSWTCDATDADGNTTINIPAETGFDFSVEDPNGDVFNGTTTFDVSAIATIELPLDENVVSVGVVTATDNGDDGALIEWGMVSEVELRHDDGTATGQLGYGTGTANSVLGSIYNNNAEITEISWYLTDNSGVTTINLFIFALKPDGTPDETNILFQEMGVTSTLLEWNTFELPSSVSAPNGFFVGASCEGFLALAMDDGIDEPYVAQVGNCVGAFDYTAGDWSDIYSGGFPNNFLMRVTAYDYGQIAKATPANVNNSTETLTYIPLDKPIVTETASKAIQTFDLYFMLEADQATPANWTAVATDIASDVLNYTDTDNWPPAEFGNYVYAVIAQYETGEADPTFSNVLSFVSNVESMKSEVNVYPNPSNGVFTVSVNGTYTLQVVDITGKVISTQEITNTENINLDQAGVYMLRLTNNVETLNYKVIVK